MIEESYVSFETAKLLKEKGFKNWCYRCYGTAVYHKGVPISFDEECDLKDEGREDEIEYIEGGCLYDFGCDNRKEDENLWAAPTLWVAMKWLMEKGFYIFVPLEIDYDEDERGGKWYHDAAYYPDIIRVSDGKIMYDDGSLYAKPEQAYEAAIKYCLENLI
jgi:hypothetical protein